MRRHFDPFPFGRSLGGFPREVPGERTARVRRRAQEPAHPPERHIRPQPRRPAEPPPHTAAPRPPEPPPRRVEIERRAPSERPVAEHRVAERPVAEHRVAAAAEAPALVATNPDLDEIERIKERITREGEREVERKTRDILVGFLDVVDDLDRALAGADAVGRADQALLRGVQLVRERFLDKLAAHGVEREGEVGDTFDPELHEALATAPAQSPGDEGKVVAIVKPGYRIEGELLRPASVVVGKHP